MESFNKEDLTREIIESKQQGELTSKGLYLISKLIAHYARRDFKTSHDRSHAILYAADKIMENKNWLGFNEEVSDNSFAYMAQVIKGYFAGYKKFSSK